MAAQRTYLAIDLKSFYPFRTLQVGDTVVPFEDLVEVSGEGIMDIDAYLGIGEE